MDTHVRTLGTLNLLYGIVGGVFALTALILAGGIWGLYSFFDDPMMGIIVVTIALLHLGLALPAAVGGFFIRKFSGWARVLVTVTAALETLTVPFGTLLGAYGLWVMLSPEVEPLFEEAPPVPEIRRNHPPGRRTLRATASAAPDVRLERVTED